MDSHKTIMEAGKKHWQAKPWADHIANYCSYYSSFTYRLYRESAYMHVDIELGIMAVCKLCKGG